MRDVELPLLIDRDAVRGVSVVRTLREMLHAPVVNAFVLICPLADDHVFETGLILGMDERGSDWSRQRCDCRLFQKGAASRAIAVGWVRWHRTTPSS